MRAALVLLLLVIAQIGWGAGATARTPSASSERPLILIPTAIQELSELRLNTGDKAVLSDNTMSAVYDKNVPAQGNTYLNFHVDVASEAGPFVLRGRDIRLVKDGKGGEAGSDGRMSKTDAKAVDVVAYTPLDWFMDTGAEVRGDSLRIDNKALVQFTIEVPRSGCDDLTLFILSQRIGTVGEMRELIAKEQGVK